MYVKAIASQTWDIFLRHSVFQTSPELSRKQTNKQTNTPTNPRTDTTEDNTTFATLSLLSGNQSPALVGRINWIELNLLGLLAATRNRVHLVLFSAEASLIYFRFDSNLDYIVIHLS